MAETFTFKDEESGVTLGDIARLDTLVTVVDGHAFTHELASVETLRTRNWHTDEEDERTVSHLLCDQVEFANVSHLLLFLYETDSPGRPLVFIKRSSSSTRRTS